MEREASEKRKPSIPDSPLAALEDAMNEAESARVKKRKTNVETESATLSNSRTEPSA
jgi:hypothetical protein